MDLQKLLKGKSLKDLGISLKNKRAILSMLFFLSALLLVMLLMPGRDYGTALDRIKERGEIRMLTRNNANSYYIYRENRMGFEYDLAKAFSEYIGVKLKVITPDWGELMRMLDSGEGDFIAAGMTVTDEREEKVDFSDEYLKVQQQVIVHKNNRNVKKMEDLEGKTVHVRAGTTYESRLKELTDQGLDIDIQLYDDIPTEELIRMVAEKGISVTISDSNIALLNRRYYPDVKVAFPIEEEQALGWAVKEGEQALLDKINEFFDEIEGNGTYDKIYRTYYANVEIFDYVDLKRYQRRLKTRLPEYKSIIKETSEKYGFDWRLIAAVIYQESHFNPKARSYTGVRGMMQLTLDTAREMGIENRLDPVQSIKGGVRYLKHLYDRFDSIGEPDRTLFSLASYNVGFGHVLDARKIAEEKRFNPDSWASLEQVLPLLREKKYYSKSEYGYCRGTEPVRYVNRILTYYDILKRWAIS